MIEIQPAQFSALSQVALDTFAKRLAAILVDEVESLGDMPLADVETEVKAQIKNAQFYGLHSETAISIYVTTSALMGQDFDVQFPLAGEVLSNEDLDETTKTNWLEGWTTEIFEALES
jgi:hypothetical protein